MSGLWICQLESRQDDSLVATLIVVEGIIKFGVFCGVSISEYQPPASSLYDMTDFEWTTHSSVHDLGLSPLDCCDHTYTKYVVIATA